VQQVVVVRLDGQRVLAQQVGRGEFVDLRLHGLRAAEGFAQADQAAVGVDLHPGDVGIGGHMDRVDLRDLHAGVGLRPSVDVL
jgi:hypothetical protein